MHSFYSGAKFKWVIIKKEIVGTFLGHEVATKTACDQENRNELEL